MANDREFRDQVQELGKLIAQFNELPESAAKIAAKELVQLLMDVHGAGLEKVMEIVFDSGASGAGIIDKLGQDSIAGSLLLLHSLHPDDLETRVRKAVDRLRPRLRKLGYTAELTCIEEGAVELRLATSGHTCGSTIQNLRSIAEDGIYEFAPDVISLKILGLDEPASSGFVALETLLGQRTRTPFMNAEGADHA